MGRAVVTVVVCVLLLAGVAPVAAGSDDQSARPAVSAVSTDHALDMTRTYELIPGRPGEIQVVLQYDVPDAVTSVETRVPENATVTDTSNFAEGDERWYTLDDGADSGTVTYRLPVNETTTDRVPLGTDGEYLFVDAGPWALFRQPSTSTRWSSFGDIPLSREDVATEGVVSDQIVFLGASQTYERRANGQTFRLVVPAAATLSEPPAAILDSLADASARLSVGARDDEVVVFAAPTETVAWGVRGLHTGESDIWVRDEEPLSTANNVWIHEYVHSRQAYEATPETSWFTEGSATYYAALLTLEQGHIGHDEFESWLALGGAAGSESVVLADPSTWGFDGDYRKGALVAGALDYRLRVAGDGSLTTVFAAMNAHEGALSQTAFERDVLAAGNRSVRTDAARFTTTNATPTTWPLAAHIERFGAFPGHIVGSFVVDEERPAVVSGPYRTESLTEKAGTLVVTNETLSLPVRVRNDGGRPTTYDLTVTAGGGESRLTGTLAPGESTVGRLNRTFDEPGTYTLNVGEEDYIVFVRDPATAEVVGLSVAGAAATVGEEMAVTATVLNDDPRPGEVSLVFTLDGRVVSERQVLLAPGEQVTITETVVPTTAGTVEVGIGDVGVTVLVDEAPPSTTAIQATTATQSPTTQTTSPGFGLVAPLVAILVLFGRVVHRTRRRGRTR